MSGVSGTERLRALIKGVKDATGESYDDIARRSGLPKSTVHSIATKTERTDMLPAEDLRALAVGLGLPARVVIQAALQDAGLVEDREGTPPEAALLIEAMRDLAEPQRQRLLDVSLEVARAFRQDRKPPSKVTRLRPADTSSVLEAIERDPYLLPEAKAHFRNQYTLLLRVQRAEDEALPYAAHGEAVEPVSAERQAELEAIAKEAARKNPHSPASDK